MAAPSGSTAPVSSSTGKFCKVDVFVFLSITCDVSKWGAGNEHMELCEWGAGNEHMELCVCVWGKDCRSETISIYLSLSLSLYLSLFSPGSLSLFLSEALSQIHIHTGPGIETAKLEDAGALGSSKLWGGPRWADLGPRVGGEDAEERDEGHVELVEVSRVPLAQEADADDGVWGTGGHALVTDMVQSGPTTPGSIRNLWAE